MKKLLALSFALVTACSASPSHSQSSSITDAVIEGEWNSSLNYEYFIDQRFVDGNLLSLQLIKDENGYYDLVRSVTTAGFGSPAHTTEDLLASGLTCKNEGLSDPAYSICSKDMRPVDGALTEVTFTADSRGHFAAVLSITGSGFGNVSTDPVITELGENLTQRILHIAPAPAAVENYTYSADARPVDGNLFELKLIKNENDRYDLIRSVTTAGHGFPVTTKTKLLASNLTCSTDLNRYCSIDARPVDGNLIEVRFTADQKGKYTAVLTVTSSGFSVNPSEVVETVIGKGLTFKAVAVSKN